MNARSLALVALLGTGLLSPLAAAETIALRGATVHTVGPNGTLQNATVIMQDGVIAAVGKDVRIPAGARVVDVTGQFITPGLIDAYGRLGVTEVDGEASTVDESAKGLPYSAAFSVAEAIEPRGLRIQVNRAEGITAGLVAPEASIDGNGLGTIIAGQASFLRLKPPSVVASKLRGQVRQ